jgi:hypothetical protein
MSSPTNLGGKTYQCVSMPTSPGLSQVGVDMVDAVAVVSSPFVPGQSQTQAWPGADLWTMTITLPKLTAAQAAAWRGFIAELRGMQNIFQLGDPFGTAPRGVALGAPVATTVDPTLNLASAITLATAGWTPNINGQLKAGDYISLLSCPSLGSPGVNSYRLHQVCEDVNSDANGDATITIWPSLREAPPSGLPLILRNTTGTFRLAQNRRGWQNDFGRLSSISLKCVEAR